MVICRISGLLRAIALIAISVWSGHTRCNATAVPPQSDYTYTGEAASSYLGSHLSVLQDKTGELTIQDVASSSAFSPESRDIPDFGISSSAYWAKLTLTNDYSMSRMFLHLAHSEIDELDIYQVSQSGAVQHVVHAGQTRPVNKTRQPYSEFAFPLDIPTGTNATIFLRVASSKQLRLPLTLESPMGFSIGQQSRSLFIGSYLGIMLVMALYNLFIFFSTRERAYAIYVLYILLVGSTQLAFFGILSFSIFQDLPWLSSHASLFLTGFTAFAAGEFMTRFIHVKDHIPRALTLKWILYAVLTFPMVLDILGYSEMAYRSMQGAALLFALFQLVVIARIAFTGSRPARFFLIAWISFLVGIITFILKDVGVLPFNDVTRFAMTIGSAVEVVLLSLGLADKINVLRAEKERNQERALVLAKENERMVLDQNVLLEEKVDERTHALQASNDHLKRTQTQLVQSEKMASLGQLTAGIAHEINNPINFISSSIKPLKRDLFELKEVLDAYRDARINGRDLDPVKALEERIGLDITVKEVEDILSSMESGAARTSEIVRGLRTFSRLDEYDLKTADVNEGIRSTLVVLAPQVRDTVSIDLDLQQLPPVECYPGKLNQVFMNLLNNAVFAVKQKHGTAGGKVRVASYIFEDNVIFEVQDNGTGMDEATQQRLFEPFFTTKDVGEGTGLGLSIVLTIIEDHQGKITVQSKPGEGTTFTITIPLEQTERYAKRA